MRKLVICALLAEAYSSAALASPRRDGAGVSSVASSAPKEIKKGLEAIQANRFDDANVVFNRALKLDPRNPLLNFLNAFAYESGAGGLGERLELARVGYRLALHLDPAFWPAAYQLGMLALSNGDAENAQRHFAKAILTAPERPELFYGLAAASYANSDLATALASLNQARVLGEPQTQDQFRIAAIVYAAAGQIGKAKTMLAFLSANGDQTAAVFTSNRIAALSRNFSSPPTGAVDRLPVLSSPENQVLVAQQKKMANIDVIIIHREEASAESRGVNLLNALRLQFGNTLISVSSSKTTDFGVVKADVEQESRGMFLTIPAVTYSMNISNSSDSFSRIRARPTIVAFDGQTSRYFNGAEITYTADGTLSSQSYSKPVGLMLEVTPQFATENVVNLKVHADMSAFAANPTEESFDRSLVVSKSSTDVSVSMTYGQTLVLSAGTSSTEHKNSSGVPVLRDVPIIQNFFSHKTRDVRESSLLVLLTLRRPTTPQDRWAADGPLENGDGDPDALENLKSDYAHWFRQPSSLAVTLSRLSRPDRGNIFRAGDVRLSSTVAADTVAHSKMRNRFLEDVVSLFYF